MENHARTPRGARAFSFGSFPPQPQPTQAKGAGEGRVRWGMGGYVGRVSEALAVPGSVMAMAELVGVSHPAVIKAQAKGTIPRDGTLHQWLLAYTESLRNTAAGREQSDTLTAARIAQLEADTSWKQIQAFERTGAIADSVQPLMDAWADYLRTAIMAAGARILETCAEKGVDLHRDDVYGPLRAALRAGAQYPSGLDPEDDPGGIAADPGGALADGGVGAEIAAAA